MLLGIEHKHALWSHGDDLVGPEDQSSLGAGRVLLQDVVHDTK